MADSARHPFPYTARAWPSATPAPTNTGSCSRLTPVIKLKTLFLAIAQIRCHVPVPFSLRLGQWCAADCPRRQARYTLDAVVFHTGVSAASGHYVCYVRAAVVEQHPWSLQQEPATSDAKSKGHRIGEAPFLPCGAPASPVSLSDPGSARGSPGDEIPSTTLPLSDHPGAGVAEDNEGVTAAQPVCAAAAPTTIAAAAPTVPNEDNGEASDWILFDDTRVERMRHADMQQLTSPRSQSPSTAYVLFYSCAAD